MSEADWRSGDVVESVVMVDWRRGRPVWGVGVFVCRVNKKTYKTYFAQVATFGEWSDPMDARKGVNYHQQYADGFYHGMGTDNPAAKMHKPFRASELYARVMAGIDLRDQPPPLPLPTFEDELQLPLPEFPE